MGQTFHGYERHVNMDIPTCDIMGVNVAAINVPWLLRYLSKHIKELSGDYITVANVHTSCMAYKNADYCRIQNSGIMAIPDGGPLSRYGRAMGYENMERVTGPDLMEALLKEKDIPLRHFFYGASQETLDKIKDRLSSEEKNITICGMYSPPFRKLTKDEDEKVIKLINETKPDIIWVALGAPKQEIWMAKHQGKVQGLMIGVGAAFDYYAGNIRRAPVWLQKNNLEWFYRLMQDPKRLWKRYGKTNVMFLIYAWKKRKEEYKKNKGLINE